VDRKIVEYLVQGQSYRFIREALRIGNDRISRVRALASEQGYLDGTRPIPPYPEAVFPDPVDRRSEKQSSTDTALLEKRDWILDRLQVGWRPITVFEEIGIAVTKSSFYRFLHRHSLARLGSHYRARVIPEIVHEPGEVLQLDWGKLRDVWDEKTSKRKTLWAFTGVMGVSRYTMVRLVWTNDVPTTLAAIESMLQELGGVPKRITSDNPKCFALVASDYEPLLNPAFERFASHYGFTIECLPPRDPQKKGKVERLMPYVRRLYEAHGMEWQGLDESQSYINKKLAIANERKHGTTMRRPIDDLLQVEAGFLKELPAIAYEVEQCAEAKVRKDGHVRIANKYYSLDEQFIGKEVFYLANSKQISIFFQGKLIEVHEKLIDPYRSKQTKAHHLKPWEQSMREDSFYRKRALRIGPDVERLITIILSQGEGFIDTRKVWGILSLDKKFNSTSINTACRDAIGLQSYSYRTVMSLLRLQMQQKETDPNFKPQSGDNKFVRPLSVYGEQLELLKKLKH